MARDELQESFDNALRPDSRKDNSGPEEITILEDDGTEVTAYLDTSPRRRFPKQMSKWYNTTSGFICGIFGGFLMVTIAGAVVAAIGFAFFLVAIWGTMQVNLLRCNGEYSSERGQLTEKAIQECRVKVGLGRSDGSDKGYWK